MEVMAAGLVVRLYHFLVIAIALRIVYHKSIPATTTCIDSSQEISKLRCQQLKPNSGVTSQSNAFCVFLCLFALFFFFFFFLPAGNDLVFQPGKMYEMLVINYTKE